MKKYKSKLNGKVVIIISDRAAGMCYKTLGVTMVVYHLLGFVINLFYLCKKYNYET